MQTTGNFLKENVWGEKKQMTSGKLARSWLPLPEGQRMRRASRLAPNHNWQIDTSRCQSTVPETFFKTYK